MNMRVQKPEKAADFLPNPETLEAYDYVINGSAKVILDMIEKEQRHRHSVEERALAIQSSGLFFGQILAALVAISVVIGTVILALDDKVAAASFLAIVGLSCMTVAYVKGRQVVAQGLRRLESGSVARRAGPASREAVTEVEVATPAVEENRPPRRGESRPYQGQRRGGQGRR